MPVRAGTSPLADSVVILSLSWAFAPSAVSARWVAASSWPLSLVLRAWAASARALALSSVLCSMPPEPPMATPSRRAATAVTQKAVLGLRTTQAKRRPRRGGCRSGGGKSGAEGPDGGAAVLMCGDGPFVKLGRTAVGPQVDLGYASTPAARC